MKLFQIEEPEGAPDPDAPGVAVGIHLAPTARVALSIGGNAEVLGVAEGTPGEVMAALRERSEKLLARPVTHCVIASDLPDEAAVRAAAEAAGVVVLSIVTAAAARQAADQAASPEAAAFGAARLAEDAAPAA